MDASTLLLAQMLSIGGLVGATGAYAGILRRRQERRLEAAATANSSASAVQRIDRHMALSRLEHTYIRSAYRRDDR